MTDAIKNSADADLIRMLLPDIEALLLMSRKQATMLRMAEEDPVAGFDGAFTAANMAVAELAELADILDWRADAEPEAATQASATVDDDAPDYGALHEINSLIECDLFETLDNVSESLELVAGMFVYSRTTDLFGGSDERCAGMVHQLSAARAAVGFVANEVSKQIHGPARALRAGGAA